MQANESPLSNGGSGLLPDATPVPEIDDESRSTVHYDVVALPITIYYNREGDHDHNGMMFALCDNLAILRYIRALARVGQPGQSTGTRNDTLENLYTEACKRACKIKVDLPVTPQQAKHPHPLVRPLVLRARRGDRVTVTLHPRVPPLRGMGAGAT